MAYSSSKDLSLSLFWGEVGGTGVWTQGLPLEPLHQPSDGFFFKIGSHVLFAQLALSCVPPDLCLLSS
jgi:hypothetical protein